MHFSSIKMRLLFLTAGFGLLMQLLLVFKISPKASKLAGTVY